MNQISSIRPSLVEFIPSALDPGVLYISNKYRTATHLCACGCGNRVVTPLNPSGWQVTNNRDGAVSLYPSIGSWSLPCNSHYWIRENRIQWAPKWTKEEIAGGRERDRRDQEAYFKQTPPAPSLWQQLGNWIKGWFS